MVSGINQNVTTILSGVNPSAGQKTERAEETKPLDRIEELKRQIDAGEYKIDLQKTAQKVAEALL
jgi:anti-sigma28 factor (negative regulator of flagellin synthesis)